MKPLLTIIAGLLWIQLFCQDVIHLKDETFLRCKVLEIGESEVKYVSTEESTPVYSINKAKIYKIVYESGKTVKFRRDKINLSPEFYNGQKKNAITFNFIGVITNNHLDFYYERSLKPNRTIEFGLGIIGIGNKLDESYSETEDEVQTIYWPNAEYGVSLRAGYKLKNSPSFYYNKMRYAHLLKGSYIKPEAIFSAFKLKTDVTQNGATIRSEYSDVFSGAVVINFGHQWIFSNKIVIDVHLGFGFGFSNHSDKTTSHYAFAMMDGFPLAITGGVNLGWAF